jgi:DMSO/TMAO reductase YedYZ molybdopterin-dependent catalytic subunit
VPFRNILAEAGLKPEVKGIYIEAKDGFYEYVDLQVAMDPRVMLVYDMSGVPLPVEHGYPLRIYIPNRFGMKQPKWITRMEAVSEARTGYWVDRGWDEEAIIKATSVIDTIPADKIDPSSRTIPVGGIAFAGDRGISKVEIQVDGGEWVQAQLRNPPLSPLTWVQWRYDWPAQPGTHNFAVRAYDGAGKLQETDSQPPEWSGATGIDSAEAFING